MELLDGARRLRRVIRRNLAFSLVYNAVAAACAIAGLVGPLLAAILMPCSSLTVVASSVTTRTFAAAGGSTEAPPRREPGAGRAERRPDVETIFVLLPLALLIAAIAVGFFVWAARIGTVRRPGDAGGANSFRRRGSQVRRSTDLSPESRLPNPDASDPVRRVPE